MSPGGGVTAAGWVVGAGGTSSPLLTQWRDGCPAPDAWIPDRSPWIITSQQHSANTSLYMLPCKAKRQYLLTQKVSRYCLLALRGSLLPLPRSLGFYIQTPSSNGCWDAMHSLKQILNHINDPKSKRDCNRRSRLKVHILVLKKKSLNRNLW